MPAFQQILMSHADNPLVLAVLVSFVVGFCVRLFRFLRRVDALSLIGLLCSVVILGHGAGWLYFNALVLYGIVSVIGKINSELGRTVAFQSLLTGIAFLFIANSYFGFGEVGLAFPILQMILFLKFLVFIWEVSTGRIQSMPLMAYLAWTGLPFTDIYLRPSEFMAQTESGRVSPKPLGKPFIADTLVRLLMLLCAVGIEWMAECLASQNHLLLRLFQVFLSGPWGFYLHAAGCSGLLRNAGAIAGFTVPENFKSPFLATNISDFWSRWNIGATRAFRDILFFNRFGLSFYNPYLNTMIVFLAMGAWHAVNPYWLLFGFIHGLGFCVYIAVGSQLDWSKDCRLRWLGWGITYLFVCSCWAVPSQLIKLFKHLI